MSTLNCGKNILPPPPPEWTYSVSEQEYHAATARGGVMSSGMLKEFRACPAQYRLLVCGGVSRRESDAMRFGRAVHKLLLEGEAAFAATFLVGGPLNERTGRSFSPGTKAFEQWLGENGLERNSVLTPAEAETARTMRKALRAHPEAARLFDQGWPERSARASCDGVECQIRLDWLRGDGVAVDLKTTDDMERFESDARRYGYLHQFAFYRDVAREAGGGELSMTAVVLEKKPPFRIGVWRFGPEALAPYSAQNKAALIRFRQCRENDRWPTGYEKVRNFPPAGIPPVWLN